MVIEVRLNQRLFDSNIRGGSRQGRRSQDLLQRTGYALGMSYLVRAPVVPVVASVVLMGLFALGAGAASAETKSETDRRSDVQRWNQVTNEIVHSPHANGDIIGYRVSFDSNRLYIVLRYRALNFSDGLLIAGGEFRTSDSLSFQLQVITKRGNRAGRLLMRGDTSVCRVRHRVSYRSNQISMRVPSRCFGSPQALQASLGTTTSDQSGDPVVVRADFATGRILPQRFIRVTRD